MSTEELFVELTRADVRLWVEDGRLRYNAPKGALGPELRERLIEHRDALISRLASASHGVPSAPTHKRSDAFEGTQGRQLDTGVYYALRSNRAPLPVEETKSGVYRTLAPPLSFVQEQHWFLHQISPDSAAYNVAIAVVLGGALDRSALEKALEAIVDRHVVLRTTCATVAGRPEQTIHARMSVPVTFADLRGVPEHERAATADRLAAKERATPFDLARGPFLRAALHVLRDDEHRLVVTTHHFVVDGVSIAILLRELAAFYGAFRARKPVQLPPLPIQYGQYAASERASAASARYEAPLAYWKARLTPLPSPLDLPTDRPRPAVPSHRGAAHSFVIPRALADGVTAMSRAGRATPYIVLLAALQALLHRYTGQDDILVATASSNRGRRELDGLIGSFSDNLLLLGDLAGNPTFRELVARTRAVAFEAYAHQDVPFVKLVEALSVPRDRSRQLYQVMFVLHDALTGGVEMPGLAASLGRVPQDTSRIDLTFEMTPSSEGLATVIEYDRDLFDASTIERMAAHLQALLRAVVADPDRSVRSLPLLTPDEERLVAASNATDAPYPDTVCLHELFEAQVERTPDAIAVVCSDARLSYRDLARAVNHLAHALRVRGARPNELIAVIMEKGWEQVVATLAIMQAGAAYVPLDASLPRERLRQLLTHARVEIAVTQARLEERLELPDEVRLVAVDARYLDAPEQPALPRVQTPEDLAYVIFTSGSTGAPKGVMIDHRGAVNTVVDLNERFGVGPGDRIFALSSLSFDLSVYDFFGALAAGATIVVPRSAEQRDPASWAEWIAAEKVTIWNSVPALMTMLVEHEAPRGDRMRSLRAVWLSGDWIPLTLPDRVRALVPDAQVLSMGGATEASIWSISYPIDSVDPASPSIPYGKALKNQRFYVFDQELAHCPVGVVGMLYIGGIGVAKGYLHDDELTAAAFIDHPGLGERVYRTGDLGRLLPDGNIQFVGRRDFQVKIGGYRIETGEIEALLSQHPEVKASVVEPWTDDSGAKRLVAYVVPSTQAPPPPADLRTFLRDRLPEYMVPATYVALEELPLSPNGKVDRRKLSPPQLDRADPSQCVAPRTREEEVLFEIWSTVLRLDRFGVHDNFFELGGDSIVAIQVISRATRAGLRLSARQLFEHPTIADLVSVIGTAAVADAEQGPVTGLVALTPVQSWFLALPLPRRAHWNQAIVLDAYDPVDPDAMARVVEVLMEHHDALRLRLRDDGASVTQWCAAPGDPAPFERVDLAELLPAEHGEVMARVAARAHASLDIEAGPVARVVLFDRGPELPSQILMVAHHLAVDGVSWRVVVEDLHIAYAQILRGEPPALPPKTSSFKRWSQWVNDYAKTEQPVLAAETFWLTSAQQRATPVPRDFAGSNLEVSTRAARAALNPDETHAFVQGAAARVGLRVDDLLLAALLHAWRQWTGGDALRVDLEAHGRDPRADELDLSRTVGWFTTIYPVVLFAEHAQLPGLSEGVREQLERVPGRGLDFGVARYLTGGDVEASLSALPRAEIAFNNLGRFDEAASSFAMRPLSESLALPHAPEGERTHVIEVLCDVTDDRLHVMCLYSENLHRAETIERFLSDFIAAVRSFVSTVPKAAGYRSEEFAQLELSGDELAVLLAEVGVGGSNR